MAQPMFGSLSPEDMIRRLMQTGGDETYTVTEKPKGEPVESGGLTVTEKRAPAEVPTGPVFKEQPKTPFGGDDILGRLTAPPAAPSPFAGIPPAAEYDTAPTKNGEPDFSAASKAFSPAALPEKSPFAPVQVEGAIRTGMYNPAGSTPWDRSLTANSAEEELRLRQDAKYNSVLDMIRPGGIGMPGTTGPIVGLQPHEAAMLASLGGKQANDLTQGRQIASTEGTAERDMQLRAMLGNQTAQTQRDVADITGKAHVAGAQASHNPATIKAQFAAQFLANNGDPAMLGGAMNALNKYMPGAPQAGGVGQDTVAGDSEYRAGQTLKSLQPLLGKANEAGKFQFDPASMNPANMGKLVETYGTLPPEAQKAFARQMLTGQYGPANDVIDNAARHFASNALLAAPPPMGGDLKYPTQYSAVLEGNPLVQLNAVPGSTALARGAQTLNSGMNMPYNQLTVGGRKVPFSPSGAGNDVRKFLGMGADERKKAPEQAGYSGAFLRQLLELQNQTQPK